ncbi:MAG: hypothetical protein EAZ91_22205 [Cytophagales bacterium]|nr:MAG: hypothetical protein EAZ91_22205 [Cytophagales bacterium]
MRFLLYLLLLALTTCTPPDQLAVLPDTDYVPVQPGQYRVYTVTEQRFGPGGVSATRQYTRRETLGLPFRTLTGNMAYPLTYAHQSATSPIWITDSLGTVEQTPTEYWLTTGSRTTVQLTFPLFDGQRWDGNRYNALGPDEFLLQRCHQPFRTDTKTYDRTMTVVQQNDSTLVGQDKRIAVYAYQIGLVYAERQQVRYCANSPGCGRPTAIAYGIRQFVRLLEHGNQ